MNSGRIVAVDHGTKRVGVAVSDPLRMFAQPFGTFTPDEALLQLKTLHARDGIIALVIGWPLTMEGEEGPSTERVQQYINRIVKALPDVPIVRWDERYTSEIASEAIRSSGASRKGRRDKGRIDRAAAAVMLTEYLNSQS